MTDGELLEAAEAALAALALGHGHLFRRYRRAFLQREGRRPTPQEVMGSAARAAGFGLQKAALRQHRATTGCWPGRPALYVARTSGRRTPVED